MSSTLAFSDAKFDSTSYAAYRPTYGRSLFDQLFAYHAGSHDTALDLGCGTGQISTTLADHFLHVYGVDTSQKMLDQASKRPNIEYRIGGAESLPLSNESVDLVTVGQAAHWFNHEAWFREMHRILRPRGTLSFWSYNEAVFTDSREATSLLNHYFHAEDKLGPHWPQPGRGILESAMDGVDPPEGLFSHVEKHYTAQRGSLDASSVAKEMPLKFAELYTRTSSSFHNWQALNPEAIARNKGGTGDVMDAMFDEIKEVTKWTDESVVRIHWPTIAVLARKA